MAWRNVWRNRRRTIVTVAAMTLALWVMILYTGLVEGYLAGMERNILNLELGDVQVFALDFRDNPSLYSRIENPEGLLERVEALPKPTRAAEVRDAALDRDSGAGQRDDPARAGDGIDDGVDIAHEFSAAKHDPVHSTGASFAPSADLSRSCARKLSASSRTTSDSVGWYHGISNRS